MFAQKSQYHPEDGTTVVTQATELPPQAASAHTLVYRVSRASTTTRSDAETLNPLTGVRQTCN